MGTRRKGIKVILEDYEEGKAEQLWKNGKYGETDKQGYFTLENFGLPKLLTATSESDLRIKGNITMYEMNITS